MATINIREFGGIMPAIDQRNLPPSAAQTASRLDMRFGDFRPLPTDGSSVMSVASATKSIYKTPTSGTWLSSTNVVNYASGQVFGASERVYMTGRSAYPEAWAAGNYRRLGVPRPAAPTAEITAQYDPYTPKEREDDIEINLVGGLAKSVRDVLVEGGWIGAKNNHGMVQWTTAAGFTEDNHPNLVFGEIGSGGVLTNPLTKGWLLDPKLDGFWHPLGTYYCVPIHAYGYWYTPKLENTINGLEGKLRAFYVPKGPNVGDPLFTEAQITSFMNMISDHFDTNSEYLEAQRGKLTAVVDAFHKLVSTNQDPAMVDAVTEYYAQSSVTTEISAALDNLVDAMLNRLEQAYNYTPVDLTGGGA